MFTLENLDNQSEYTLKYFYGSWISTTKIFASSDEEAIFDVEDEIATDKLSYRLYLGKRVVKEWTNKYGNQRNNY